MSLWSRLFGKTKAPNAEAVVVRRDIPDAAMETVQVLRCDPSAVDPEQRFSIGKWGLTVVGDEHSHRLAKGVLKKSAGKTLRLEPNAEVGHRGVISSAGGGSENAGYKWLYVDVDLRAGSIRFHQGGSEVWSK